MAAEKPHLDALNKASRRSARAPHISKSSRRRQASSVNCISVRIRDRCPSRNSTKILMATRFAMRMPRARHGHTEWIEWSRMLQTANRHPYRPMSQSYRSIFTGNRVTWSAWHKASRIECSALFGDRQHTRNHA